MALTLGMVTPGLHVNQRFGSPEWEMTASLDDVTWLVHEAERAGYDWISCAEHIAVPVAAAETRGSRYFDPFSTLGYFAASTSSIGLLTHVAVLPYHHPLELVKRLGTLDVLSGGRVIAGVGVGSLQPEFEVLGHRFDDRGNRADDAIRAIRAAWGRRTPEYHGPYYEFEGFVVEPSGLARDVAIWVGGRSRRSLRRAVELGDAWIPFGLRLEQLGTMLYDPAVRERLARYNDDHGRPLGMVFAPESPIDPLGEPDRTAEILASYIAIGATGFSLRFDQKSPAHCCEQLAALQALVRSTGWSDPQNDALRRAYRFASAELWAALRT